MTTSRPTVPRRMVLGVGVEAGTPVEHLRDTVRDALDELGADPDEIAVVATIVTRADEPAIRIVADDRPVRLYPAAALDAVPVPNPSAVVRRLTGTASVAEAAAILGAREEGGAGLLVLAKRRGVGVTVALAR